MRQRTDKIYEENCLAFVRYKHRGGRCSILKEIDCENCAWFKDKNEVNITYAKEYIQKKIVEERLQIPYTPQMKGEALDDEIVGILRYKLPELCADLTDNEKRLVAAYILKLKKKRTADKNADNIYNKE